MKLYILPETFLYWSDSGKNIPYFQLVQSDNVCIGIISIFNVVTWAILLVNCVFLLYNFPETQKWRQLFSFGVAEEAKTNNDNMCGKLKKCTKWTVGCCGRKKLMKHIVFAWTFGINVLEIEVRLCKIMPD